MTGCLYVVPTPLGNLEDVTLRALRVLKEVRAVYCEDTRRTRALLTHFDIRVPALRYDEHDPRDVERVLERLRGGDSLALVSDGGTPVISDPGLRVIAAARRERLQVCSLPGPSAPSAAVAGSGLPGDSFLFLGFLPRSEGKRLRALREAARLGRTAVVYESPFRVARLFDTIVRAYGPDVPAAVVRELSKAHEEWLHGSAAEIGAELNRREKLLGEFAVVIGPRRDAEAEGKEESDG